MSGQLDLFEDPFHAHKAHDGHDMSQYLLHILSLSSLIKKQKIFSLYSQLKLYSDAEVIEEEILNFFFISSLILCLNNLLLYS